MNSHFREQHPISSRSREEEEEDKEEEGEEEKRIALITSRSFRRRINRKVPKSVIKKMFSLFVSLTSSRGLSCIFRTALICKSISREKE